MDFQDIKKEKNDRFCKYLIISCLTKYGVFGMDPSIYIQELTIITAVTSLLPKRTMINTLSLLSSSMNLISFVS